MSTPQIAPDASLQGLSFLWLEITSKCNLECVHCYADSGPQEQLFGGMNAEDWLEILREAAELGCRQVQFIGGEPTLHPGLPRMIRVAREAGYEFIEVYTNATHITDELLRVFVDEGVHLAVSFYSDVPAVHDAITTRRGSFQRTVANLQKLVSAGLPVRAGIIETEQNRGHGERARRFLEGIGITDAKVDGQRGIGRGATVEIDTRERQMAELCGECWKGKLCVTSAGAVYPCVFSRFEQVGAASDGIAALVDGDALSSFRRELREYSAASRGTNDELASCNPDRCSPCTPGSWKDEKPPRCSPECSPASAQNTESRHAGCKPTCAPPGDWEKPKPEPPSRSAGCNPRCSPPGPWPDEPEPSCDPTPGSGRRSLPLSFSTGCNPQCSPPAPWPFRPQPKCAPAPESHGRQLRSSEVTEAGELAKTGSEKGLTCEG
jgi:MoaA/NifB/PqqE/SkfB family radical SAM enzyme